MTNRRFAHLYLESKIKFSRSEGHYLVRSDAGYLFSQGRWATKILPENLPEWYVYGYMYKRHGYLSAKGVKELLYVPNYVFNNHLYKYDSLYVSFESSLVLVPYDFGMFAEGYDAVIDGWLMLDYLDAVDKYSPSCETHVLRKEMVRKKEWYESKGEMRFEKTFISSLTGITKFDRDWKKLS